MTMEDMEGMTHMLEWVAWVATVIRMAVDTAVTMEGTAVDMVVILMVEWVAVVGHPLVQLAWTLSKQWMRL